MSCFPKIFRKRNGRQTTKEMKELQEHRIRLIEIKAQLERQIKDCIQQARTNAKENKTVALRALQRKKKLSKDLRDTDKLIATIELQIDAMEIMIRNAAFKASMENLHRIQTVSQLETSKNPKWLDNLTDQNKMVHEIAKRTSFIDITEEELSRELEQLEMEELNKEQKSSKSTEFLDFSVHSNNKVATAVKVPVGNFKEAEKVVDSKA